MLWTTIDTRSGVTWANNATQTFIIASPGAYSFYRIYAPNISGVQFGFAEWITTFGTADIVGAVIDGDAAAYPDIRPGVSPWIA